MKIPHYFLTKINKHYPQKSGVTTTAAFLEIVSDFIDRLARAHTLNTDNSL